MYIKVQTGGTGTLPTYTGTGTTGTGTGTGTVPSGKIVFCPWHSN